MPSRVLGKGQSKDGIAVGRHRSELLRADPVQMERTMTVRTCLRTALAAAMLTIAGVAAAQQSVSSTDIQRLQDQVYEAGSELARVRSSDSGLASRMEDELDELREEVIYLKVRLRKNGSVNRTEYAE